MTTDVTILTMKLSGNRQEHYVRITCDGRTMDVRKYDGQYLNRAEYERDFLRHVLLGEPKPDLMADKYADPAPDQPEQPSVAEAARVLLYLLPDEPLDWTDAKLAAVKAYLKHTSPAQPVALMAAVKAALESLTQEVK